MLLTVYAIKVFNKNLRFNMLLFSAWLHNTQKSSYVPSTYFYDFSKENYSPFYCSPTFIVQTLINLVNS